MSYKLALCSEVYREPIEDAIRRVAEIGFDGIEIAPFQVAESVTDVPRDRRVELRQRASDAGIEVIGLHWLLVSPPGLHLTTPDAAVRARTVGYLQSLVEFASDLGGSLMVLGSPKQRNLAEGDDPRKAFDRAAAGLCEVAKTCADRGVRLLLEALHPRETNFLTAIEDVLELRDAVGSPVVGYMLDTKAMSGMHGGIEGTILEHGMGAGHFHANEPSGKGPGMGDVDFRPILAALDRSGYDGWISTEPFDYAPDPDTVARTALETLREAAGA